MPDSNDSLAERAIWGAGVVRPKQKRERKRNTFSLFVRKNREEPGEECRQRKSETSRSSLHSPKRYTKILLLLLFC